MKTSITTFVSKGYSYFRVHLFSRDKSYSTCTFFSLYEAEEYERSYIQGW